MKKLILGLVIMCGITLLTACNSSNSSIDNAEINIGKSVKFTEKEIAQAVDVVIQDFFKDSEHIELHSLSYLFSFLAKITRNLSINLYNKNHTQKRYATVLELTKEMEECIPSPSDEICKITDNELTKSISWFLNSLIKIERDVFVTRYWYSMSIKEVSNKFGISESKTKSMLMRTRNKLKKHFESEGLEL